MKTVRTETPKFSPHKSYRDPDGELAVICTPMNDKNLVNLAEAADQIEIRQANGAGWIPSIVIDRLLQALRGLAWLERDPVPEGDRLRIAMHRQVVDTRARMRVKYGRQVLAGMTHRIEGGEVRQILVLALVQRRVESCSWQLAA